MVEAKNISDLKDQCITAYIRLGRIIDILERLELSEIDLATAKTRVQTHVTRPEAAVSELKRVLNV
ncbi:MAG: hypothetical protein ACE5PO_05335 [Candidatus Bathyarchaeia archaeon]